MNFPDGFLENVVEQAIKCTKRVGPTNLVAMLKDVHDPFSLNYEKGEQSRYQEALDKDLLFFRRRNRMWNNAFDVTNQHKWVELVSWVISTLRRWDVALKKRYNLLHVVLIVTEILDENGDFWSLLPDDIGEKGALIDDVKNLLSSIRSNVVSTTGTPPLWEVEFVKAFEIADREEQWVKVSDSWMQICSSICPSIVHTQSAQLLYRYDFTTLVNIVDNFEEIMAVHFVVNFLFLRQRLEIAIKSQSSRVRFCVVKYIVDKNRNDTLNVDDEVLLVSVFIKVLNIEKEWQKWMSAFNKYPVRVPIIQPILGQCLANANDVAIKIYVNSIYLINHPTESRMLVSNCLSVVRDFANEEIRRNIWAISYERWVRWDFGLNENDRSLMNFAVSELDCAVIGYMLENLTEEEHIAENDKIVDEIKKHAETWFADNRARGTALNRLISQWQITNWALRVRFKEEVWELPTKIYLPIEVEEVNFFKATNGLR